MEKTQKYLEGDLEAMIELEAKRQRELEKQRTEEAQRLKSFIDENPKRFIELMCEATLNIDNEDGNPFIVRKDAEGIAKVWYEGLERMDAYLSGLAKIVLNEIRGVEQPKSEDGYSPFLDVVIDYFSISANITGDEIVKFYDRIAIQHELFNQVADGFASALDTACHHVFEGVPLYRKIDDTKNYERLEFDDPLYHYVYKKGEYFETGPTTHVPDWIGGLYVKDSDMDLHATFFSGEMGLNEAERSMRRRALWNEIGVSKPVTKGLPLQTHRTKLLDATDAVIARYYGPQFDKDDPNSVTPQKIVVEWLMKTYDLSKRAAEAIDVVTRPDYRK